MPHTVYARVANQPQATMLINSLLAAGIQRSAIRMVAPGGRPVPQVRPGPPPVLLWGLAGAVAGGLLGGLALSWWSAVWALPWWTLPWLCVLWGAFIAMIWAELRALDERPAPPSPVSRVEIDADGVSQAERARRICADHRAWAMAG